MAPETVVDAESGQAVPIEVVEGGPNDPFAPQNQDANSGDASQEGAPQDPSGSQVEGAVQPNPTPEVTVIGPPPEITSPAQVVPATAPAPAATPTAEPVAPDLAPLAAWMQEQQNTTTEALRQQQSTYDRQAAVMAKQIDASASQTQELRTQVREMGLRDLTPEEQQTARDRFAQEDRTTGLDSREKELTDYHDMLNVQSIMKDYEQFGVTEEMLQACETPEEMEIVAREQHIQYLTTQQTPTQTASVPEEAVPQATAPVVPATPAIPAAPEAQVPAGVHAASDVGASGRAAAQPKFNENTNSEALKENLENSKWETLQVPG